MKAGSGYDDHERTSKASVELHVRPPLSYGISEKAGGLILREEIASGETLGELLARLEARSPEAFQQIFDSGTRRIRLSIVTVVNGILLRRTEAMQRVLLDGDRITWLLMYAGG
jgi:molybdopterin converting factor small subunit